MADHSRSRRRDAGRDRQELTGSIIVSLKPEAAARAREAHAASTKGLSEVNAFLHEQGIPDMTPLIPDRSQGAVAELERQAADGPLPPLPQFHSLNTYFRIDANAHGKAARDLVASLLELPDVDSAYPEMTAHEPCVAVASNPLSSRQTYLDAKPDGIDACWMWTQGNARGQGVALTDVEMAWNLTHQDLVAKQPVVVFGNNRPGGRNHGTGVLGIVAAEDNAKGVVGIAPDVTSVAVASRFCKKDKLDTHIAAAIAEAAVRLSPGDVLLVEVELGAGLPAETQEDVFLAIYSAAGAGRVVVEAGGNSGIDLDTFPTLNRASGQFLESGAIMVGAARSPRPYDALGNTGSRIDCFAHGENVTTAGKGDLTPGPVHPNLKYTGTFDGTSAAAAIIAGAAILVQARFKALHPGQVLDSLKMREVLSKTGTPQGAGGHIGVMPDLKGIVAANPNLQ